jgi:hypothetical protein
MEFETAAKPINSGGYVLEKLCSARYGSLLKIITIGLAILGLVLSFALGYIIVGESGRNGRIENQDSKITDVRIEAATVKSDLTTIKEDLREIKRILGDINKGAGK